MLFKSVDELEMWLVEVWSKTLSTLFSMNGECICVPVFTQMADIRILLSAVIQLTMIIC